MEYLGHGRMRHAFRIGNLAIKIPMNFKGMKACNEERLLWSKHRSDAMAPVLFSIPYLCVVMPYYSEKFTGVKPTIFITNLNRFGIIDLHPYNIRISNGHPIAIDYAINGGSHGQGEPTGGWLDNTVVA